MANPHRHRHRCREHGACCGGQYLDLGCHECAKCVRCRASVTAQAFRLLEEAKARPRKPVLQNLPVPMIPRAFTENPKCWWYSREFDSTRLRNMHVKNCERMPYKMYLARARVLNPTDCKDFPYDWCGSFFVNVRVRANHARNCLLRRRDETNTRESHQHHRERCRIAFWIRLERRGQDGEEEGSKRGLTEIMSVSAATSLALMLIIDGGLTETTRTSSAPAHKDSARTLETIPAPATTMQCGIWSATSYSSKCKSATLPPRNASQYFSSTKT